MDEFERAQELEAKHREAAVNAARVSSDVLQPKGCCYNCLEVLDDGLFCDADCRTDWEYRQGRK